MPRPLFCIAAKVVIRDAETNQVSIVQILEEVQPQGLPLLIQELGVLAVWEREGDEANLDLLFRAVNNNRELMTTPLRIDFHGLRRNRSIVTLQGMPVYEPGVLRFEFIRDNVVLTSYEVAVSAPPARVAQAHPA